MIKKQLIEFKNSKQKQSPYDLKPCSPERIEVDLTYFLIEQNKRKPAENQEVTQTDEFLPKPPTPKYVPKKSGIDQETQIWDYELFDFDREVCPILNVVVDKTLEQSLLEVEEETELQNVEKFKKECERRSQQENEEWVTEIKIEHKSNQAKNELF